MVDYQTFSIFATASLNFGNIAKNTFYCSQIVRKDKIMGRKVTSISSNRVGSCSITLCLDKRSNKKSQEYPLSVCFCIIEEGKAKRFYHHLLNYYTEQYFHDVCRTTSSRSALFNVKKAWESELDSYRERLVKLSKSHNTLTMDLIKACMLGKVEETNGNSFLEIWEKIIESRKKEGRAGTAESYQWALSSFRKIVGEVKGFAVDKNVIQRWNDGMKTGVLKDGQIVGKIADASRGIYLRSCRVVWKECVRQGFLTEVEYPFSNKDSSLISIPRGKRRQQSYLNVDEMTQLYKVFMEQSYPETWEPSYTNRVHVSLGLFLAQYLCNGFNLADAARLRYNETYWNEGGKAFEFQRKKTAARSNDNSVVIVPIIEPLQKILDEIAAPPAKGGFVFPFILHGVTDEQDRRRITLLANANIREHVQRVCKEILGWQKGVTGTWARHSFATNLKLAGVEEEYIAESMGHSHGNDVTRGYQDMYPLEIRERYNMKLLKIEEDSKDEIDIDSLSLEEMKIILRKFLNNSMK